MTRQEATRLITLIRTAAMKSRSNIKELHPDVPDTKLADMFPRVFGTRLNLVEICTRVLAKPEIEPIDLYNVLVVANQEPVISVWLSTQGMELPQATLTMIQDFE